MAGAYSPGIERVYTWKVGDRVTRHLDVWDASSKLLHGEVTAVFCGLPLILDGQQIAGPYYELYEVRWDEPVFPEIYEGDRHLQTGFFDYGLNKEIK